MRKISALAAFLAALPPFGCGEDGGPATGSLGGACYPNDTCDVGLECVAGTCETAGPACGDGTCDPDESPASCPADCPLCTAGETRSCYSGPEGTEGVGTCQAGTETCLPGGSGWGPCEGEVLPIEEICANGLDDDCDGLADNVPDLDGDGFTRCDGDCCETTAQCPYPELVNPSAVEVPTPSGDPTPVDENCNGVVDELPSSCDANLALDDTDPLHGAAAIGLCETTSANSTGWGLLSAAYVRANGVAASASAQFGLLAGFGTNVAPREGSRLVVLSTGRARTPAQTDACGSLSCNGYGAGTPPTGFPQDVPNCPVSSNINDDVGLEITLRAPTNALGFAFDFKLYTFEYPEWVCSSYNDQFVALMSPAPQGSINGNIAFDSQTNPVGVNIAYLDVCSGCPLDTSELEGTGFDTWDNSGATGWLTTTAPVAPGQEFTLRFAIWDTGDQAWDSTVLIDNFRWLASPTTVGTTPAS